MKLALIFLAAYVLVISNQQLHNPKLGPYWWQTDRPSPYYPVNNGPVLFNNYQQSVYHPNYNQFQDDIPLFRQFGPRKPSLIQIDGIHPHLAATDHQSELVELFPDSQLRTNGLSRYRPDLRSSMEPMQQDRKLFFSGVTLSTFFTKTVTFSVTVPLTLTTTTSCIPLALFAISTETSACRRKRQIRDYVPIPEDNQFGLAPSQTKEMIVPTAVIPSPELIRYNRQVSVDPSALPGDVIPPEKLVMRGKRYFILSVMSTTVTTYSITTIICRISISCYKASQIGR